MIFFNQKFVQSEKFNVCLIIGAAFLITLPILIWGVPYGYDMPHHYQCALTYLDAIKSGDFYPSWTLDRNLGYGALELRMYPPLSHYVLALLDLLTGDWHLATWLTYLFWWILGSSGVYLFAREFVKPRAALFAAVLFAVMPYRLSQLYLTFLYSELSAIAVLPFCFYFLTRIIKENDSPNNNFKLNKNDFFSLNILGLTVSYAALILTHLPMTVIGTSSLGIYFFAQIRWNFKSLQYAVLKTACSLSLGLAATSFFWTKVLQERFLMAKTSVYDEVYVHYQYNFLLTFLQNYDDVSIVVYNAMTLVYDIVLFLTLFAVLPIAFLRLFSKKLHKNNLWRGVWVTFSLSIFLTTVLSRPLWDNLPLLHEVQFSWRFLGIVSIFAPLVAAAGFSILLDWFKSNKLRPFALIILGTIFIGVSFSLTQSIRGAVHTKPNEEDNYVREVGQKEGFTFWWTIWARKEFTKNSTDKVSVSSRPVNIAEWQSTERVFNIEAGESADSYVALFYHPNWHATVNDIPAEIRPADDGGMLISIPPQPSNVHLFFQETVLVRIGRWLSSIIWLCFLGFGLFRLKNRFTLKSREKLPL